MKIKIEKHPVFKKGCNFCDNTIPESTSVYTFIRKKGNSLRARMCDDCLNELIAFKVQPRDIEVVMSTDQFAKFIAGCMFGIKHYSFDMFHDIHLIMNTHIKYLGKIDEPAIGTFDLMLRDTGSDLVDKDDSNYGVHFERSSKVYQLTFCFNYCYFPRIPFCKVKQIK